jgi:hypothetical protein
MVFVWFLLFLLLVYSGKLQVASWFEWKANIVGTSKSDSRALMSHSDLIEKLKTKIEGEKLAKRLTDIREKAEPVLVRICEIFPDFTTHDIKHSEEVLQKLREIIPESLKNQMNAYEVYLLVASAYLHDIGMVNFKDLINENEFEDFLKGVKSELSPEDALRQFIREYHHTRTEKVINTHFAEFAIEDKHQAEIIGRICLGHRKENLHDQELFEPDKMYRSYPINVPLLAALLRIADELDLTFERAPLIIYEHILPRDPISQNEWQKHLSVSGVGLHPQDPFLIKCSATCENPKIHRLLKTMETKINQELDDLPSHLHQYRESGKDMPRRMSVEIKAKGYKPYDMKFSLQEKEIINLLMGERLYTRKEECLREILKNSVDACRFRRKILEEKGLTFTPEIAFEIVGDENLLIVTDNGVGMDEDVVERYLTKVGQSFYRSPEFLEKGYDFTPVSELGIGFLSCFMIANRIMIETKTDESAPLTIEIDDVSDYFIVKEGIKNETGTKITFYLKDNCREIDVEKEIRNFARHLEFSIKVILPSARECVIEDNKFEPPYMFIPEWYSGKVCFHTIEIHNEHMEGTINVILSKDEKLGFKPFTKRPSDLLAYIHSPNKIEQSVVSTEGIFVGSTKVTPEWLDSELLLTDLNIKKNAVDLTIARNNVVSNEKLEKIRSQIESLLVNRLRKLLEMLKQKAREANTDFAEVSESLFDNYLTFFNLTRLDSIIPEGFIELLKDFYYFKIISKNGVKNVSYHDIVSKKKFFVILREAFESNGERTKQIFKDCTGFTEDHIYFLNVGHNKSAIEILFPEYTYNSGSYRFTRETGLLSFISLKESNELEGIIPPTWKLAKFKNYNTSGLLEFLDYHTILNREHKFVDLLIRNKNIIDGNRKVALESFFRTMKHFLRRDFQKLITQQNEILKWFVDAKLINDIEMKDYIFSRNDFEHAH